MELKFVDKDELNKIISDVHKKGNYVYISRIDKVKTKIEDGYNVYKENGKTIVFKDEPKDMVLMIKKVKKEKA